MIGHKSQLGNRPTCKISGLCIAIFLLPTYAYSVTAQSHLDPSVLSEVPEFPLVETEMNPHLATERVEETPIALNTEPPSPFLVKTSHASMKSSQSDILAEIYFDWTRQALLEDSAKIVERAAEILQNDSTKHIDLQAVCDARGTEAYTITLGKKRTERITTYLRHLGIRSSQITQLRFGTRGNENSLHHQETFHLLAMTQSRAGCLVRLRLDTNQTQSVSVAPPLRTPFLQRIHLAEVR